MNPNCAACSAYHQQVAGSFRRDAGQAEEGRASTSWRVRRIADAAKGEKKSSAGQPRSLRKTGGFFFVRPKGPQVPAKTERGPALRQVLNQQSSVANHSNSCRACVSRCLCVSPGDIVFRRPRYVRIWACPASWPALRVQS